MRRDPAFQPDRGTIGLRGRGEPEAFDWAVNCWLQPQVPEAPPFLLRRAVFRPGR